MNCLFVCFFITVWQELLVVGDFPGLRCVSFGTHFTRDYFHIDRHCDMASKSTTFLPNALIAITIDFLDFWFAVVVSPPNTL
jgi:hypothetical protein